MNLLAFFGTLVGIILALIEIRNYFQNSPQNRSFIRFLIGVTVFFVVIGFAYNYFYLAPKSAAEKFINGFRNLDVNTILDSACSDSELVYTFTGAGGSVLNLTSLFANIRIWNENFDLAKQTTSFSWTLESFVGQNEISYSSIYTKSSSLTQFCVYEVTGLNLEAPNDNNNSSPNDTSNSSNNAASTSIPTNSQGWNIYNEYIRGAFYRQRMEEYNIRSSI
jgi:hypothetical protein